MASMILGWTLNDVTHALGMGDMNHLHQLRSEAQKAELAKTVDAILSRVELGGDIEVWHMAQQDSYIDLQDPIVIGAPMMFGGKVPEVLWYLAPNEHVDGMPSPTLLASLQAFAEHVGSAGEGPLPSPTVHLSGWHAPAEPLAPLVGA